MDDLDLRDLFRRAEQAERERDEARAKVERAHALLTTHLKDFCACRGDYVCGSHRARAALEDK